jgi:hypothetical protein
MIEKPKTIYLTLLCISIAVFIFYSPALSFSFLNYDDPLHLTSNAAVLSFDLKAMFFNMDKIEEVAPFTFLSYAIENYFFGLNPKVYHLNNILLHIFNTCLVFYLGMIWSKRNLFISIITSLIFAFHPTHVESVAWISERKDVLSTFFLLLTFLSYYQYIKVKKLKYYIFSLILFVLAVGSKFTTFLLPLIIIGFDYIENRFSKKDLLLKVPFFFIAILFLVINLGSRSLSLTSSESYDFMALVTKLINAYSFYLSKLIFPTALSPYYESGTVGLSVWNYLVPLGLLLFLFWGYLRKKDMRKEILFFTLFGVIYLLPSTKIIHFGSEFTYANRYLYVPSIPLCFILISLLYKTLKKEMFRFICISFLIFYIILAYPFLLIWKDSEKLWLSATSLNEKSSVAFGNLGVAYYQQGKQDIAKKSLLKSISLKPTNIESLKNLAVIEESRKNYLESSNYYEKALKAAKNEIFIPKFLKTRTNLVAYLGSKKMYDVAILIGERGLVNKGLNSGLSLNTGRAYFYLNQNVKAKELLLKGIKDQEQQRQFADIYYKLGHIYKRMGDTENSRLYFKMAFDQGLKEAQQEL